VCCDLVKLLIFSFLIFLASAPLAPVAFSSSHYEVKVERSPSPIIHSHMPVHTPPPPRLRPTIIYPGTPASFQVLNFYWPGSTGLLYPLACDAIPGYPDSMIRRNGESMDDYRLRIFGYRESLDNALFKWESKTRKYLVDQGLNRREREKYLGMVRFFFLLHYLFSDIDGKLRGVYYHYMLRDNAIPENLFPWIPKYERRRYETLASHKNAEVIVQDALKWWLECRIPGYDLTWSDLTRHWWFELYDAEPDLFLRPWLPIARVDYWIAVHNRFLGLMRGP
jgi:hypothetical protein